jgi:hypothetical protein
MAEGDLADVSPYLLAWTCFVCEFLKRTPMEVIQRLIPFSHDIADYCGRIIEAVFTRLCKSLGITVSFIFKSIDDSRNEVAPSIDHNIPI